MRSPMPINDGAEYGAYCSCWSTKSPDFIKFDNRAVAKLVGAYAKKQGLWRSRGAEPIFTDTLSPRPQ